MTELQKKDGRWFDQRVNESYAEGIKDGSNLIVNFYLKCSREQFHDWLTLQGQVSYSTDFEDACYSAYLCGWNVARGGRL